MAKGPVPQTPAARLIGATGSTGGRQEWWWGAIPTSETVGGRIVEGFRAA